MGVIDVDRGLLQHSAEAALHASEQAWTHMEAEFAGRVPELMQTLTPQGPYGYTIMPEVRADGSVKLPIITTREDINKAYTMIRGASDLLSSEAIVELRGAWYSFQEALNRGRVKGNELVREAETLALFPSTRGTGITGELVWVRVPRTALGQAAPPANAKTDTLSLRRQLRVLHDRFVAALRAADVEAVLDTFNDGVQSAVRNYVDDTGALVSLDGKEAHRAHYQSLFAKYAVESVGLLDRVVQEWYVFAELRLTLRRRDGVGGVVAVHTAEFFVPANDGRFIVRIGHGTDPA